jgi:hypothetical protein
MGWQFIVALVLAVPLILLPVASIWYLNVGGLYAWIKGKDAREEQAPEAAKSATRRKYGVTSDG